MLFFFMLLYRSIHFSIEMKISSSWLRMLKFSFSIYLLLWFGFAISQFYGISLKYIVFESTGEL